MIKFKNLIFDGGLGSRLLDSPKVPIGYPLETLNLTMPALVASVHDEYVKAGSDVITTNTFGANALKYGADLPEIISAGISLARKASPKYVALDVGPLGKIISDDFTFENAYEEFKKIILLSKGADIIVIETMTSLPELRAAILAAKENSSLPVFASMSFEKNLRTFFGTPVESFVITAEALGVDAVGANCSLGARQMYDVAKKILSATALPVFIQPNAGLPRFENGRTVYDETAEEFYSAMKKINDLGVTMLGGCCGTTPEFISRIATLKYASPQRSVPVSSCRVCSATEAIDFTNFRIIGERINPTGKKDLKKALLEENYEKALSLGKEQAQMGADILDVNCGMNEIDEKAAMTAVVSSLQNVVGLPLQIDSASPSVLEAALRIYHGKAVVNSVNGSDSVLERVLPLVKKYGAAVIGLTLDENGIPSSYEKRLAIADKIIAKCEALGIPKSDVFIDALTMSEASQRGNAILTLRVVEELHRRGINTVLGVSNISFGMPNRVDINAKFLEKAKAAGLTAAIINPSLCGYTGSAFAESFLNGEEGSAERYVAYATKLPEIRVENAERFGLKESVVSGLKEKSAELTKDLLKTLSPLEIAKTYVVPALDEVGALYDSGKAFLPQLIASADAAKSSLSLIERAMENTISSEKPRYFVLATVKGDVHDIGKNIVKAVVANYGYKVIDLGRDVDFERILNAVDKYYPCALGLSALMTTTAQNMKATALKVKEKFDVPILVGGAVISRSFAESFGGIYCSDAQATVKALQEYFN